MISIQGIQGSFHDIAKVHLFGLKEPILGRDSFAEVFADVAEGRADRGIIAIENSLAGPILENFTHLLNFKVQITQELFIRVAHNLIGWPEAKMNELEAVHAHPMAFAQCQKFFRQHPQFQQINNADNAAAVAMIKKLRLTQAAALASRRAAEIFGMKIIQSHLEDKANNLTRFLVIALPGKFSPQANKTTLAVKIPHRPGSLHQALGCFAKRQINLTSLVTQPIAAKAWHYTFFLDLEGGIGEQPFIEAIKELKQFARLVKILGSYQRGEEINS